MTSENLHIVLFELLILRKIHVGLRAFASIPNSVPIFVEVSNTFNNALKASLKYLNRFADMVRLKPIQWS